MSKTKYHSKLGAAVHEMASDLYDAGLIDSERMRKYDEACTKPSHSTTEIHKTPASKTPVTNPKPRA